MTAAIELWSRLLVLEPVRPCGMPRWVRPQVLCRCVALPTCFRLRLLLNSLRSLTFPPPHCVCLARLQLLIAAVDDTKADVSFEARLRLAQHVPGSEPNHLLVKVW